MRRDSALAVSAAVILVLTTIIAAIHPGCATSKTERQKTSVSRSLVIVNKNTGKVDVRFPDDGGAFSAVADGHGGWYVDGGSSRVGKLRVRALVRLRANGTLDGAFRPFVPNRQIFETLLLHGGVLYAGGWPLGVIAFDVKTGKQLWRVSNTGQGGVYSLAYWNGALYLAGTFTKVGGELRKGVAAVDAKTGAVLPWNVQLTPSLIDWKFGPIAVSGDTLYLAGSFKAVNGISRGCGEATIDLQTGQLTEWSPKCGSAFDVSGLAVVDGQVVVGGMLQAYDAQTGERLSWTKQVREGLPPRSSPGNADALAVSGNTLFLAGDTGSGAKFNHINRTPAHNLASVVLPHGRFTDWRPNIGRCTAVSSLAVSGRNVLIVGDCSTRTR